MVFGFFSAQPVADPVLGRLERSRGKWRGTVELDDGSTVPLVIVGSRNAPDASAVEVARSVRTAWPGWRSVIEQALFEHFAPYAESLSDEDLADLDLGISRDATPADLWKHSRVEYVYVAPLAGSLVTEIGISTAWDEEHTLGARFRGAEFMELNGSVLAP